MLSTPTTVQSTSFPEMTIGKTYDLTFDLGFLYYALTSDQIAFMQAAAAMGASYDAGNIRTYLYRATFDQNSTTVVLRVKPTTIDSNVQQAGTVSPLIVVSSIAVILGVISYFCLKEVKEVVGAIPPAITATGDAAKKATVPLAIIAVVIVAILFVIYKVYVKK